MNVEKVSMDKILVNEEIWFLFIVMGIGFGEDFDVLKVCYYKLVIMIDVDVDGVYICILLLIFFYCYMCLIVEVGYVYIV